MLTWDKEVKPSSPSNFSCTPTPCFSAVQEKASPLLTARQVQVTDKRISNGQTDVNQLAPFKYKWASEKCLASFAKHWLPQGVNMTRDIALWKDPQGLTKDGHRFVKRNLGFFVTADSSEAFNAYHEIKPMRAKDQLPSMSEMIDLKKERNFFENRVIEYQSGGALSWE